MSERDFNTISPSAKGLLMIKALTDIPFAREAAEQVFGKEHVEHVLREYHPRTFLVRVFHFENRYRTIDAFLSELKPSNILELSAGFSFRGLHMAQHKPVTYVDTDLPDLVKTKQQLVQTLIETAGITLTGSLQVKPLNVLDETAFTAIADTFPAGPLTIVNEGLLMYLSMEEKRQLCTIIRKILLQRGGEWITADIYIKKTLFEDKTDAFSAQLNEFLEKHRVEENKFDSFEAAAIFFEECGFTIRKKVEVVYDQLSSLKMLQHDNAANPNKEGQRKRYLIRETWWLEATSL